MILFLIKRSVLIPEDASPNKAEDSSDNIVPNEERVFGEGHKPLSNSSCESAHEECYRKN